VQVLINGGAGGKSNPTKGKGILGIEEGWRCRPKYGGVESNPTNPLGLVTCIWCC